jgi:zinc protease
MNRNGISRRLHAVLVPAVSVFLSLAAYADLLDLAAPLPVDPKLTVLKLPNGMNAWFVFHQRPPGKISLWLHVASGSINEEDNQRGLAHFLEHLAFDGSANFPPGTLVKYFESLGLRFGNDQNAFTSYTQTTYTLTLPDTKEETMDKGLLCLSDYAFRLSLLPEEVDKERKVVLEEARARKGARKRILDKLLPILLPGSRVAERLPIGKEEIIEVASAEIIRAYCTKWYRTDNTTLLVVGDTDARAVEKLISRHFAGWKAVADPANDADPGIKPYADVRAAVITDPEVAETEVSVVSVRPLTKRVTVGDFRRELVDDIGAWILDRRLGDMIRAGKAPFQSADVSIYPLLNVCTHIEAEATGPQDKAAAMISALVAEVKRARVHGFLPHELEDARKSMIASAEEAASTESTRDAEDLLSKMNDALTQRQMPLSAAQELELLKALFDTVKLEEVASAFSRNFDPAARLILVTMPEKKDLAVPAEAELLATAKDAETREIPALEAKTRPKGLLEQEPTPATVVDQAEDPDLGILSVTFSNGARVHLREMDFRKDQVLVNITLAGGEIRETAASRGISAAAVLAFSQPASDKLSSTDIRDLMTGKNVNVTGGASEDSVDLRISGQPKDLEEGFRLAHLLLTRPKIEDSALKRWKEQTSQTIEKRKVSVEAQLMERVGQLLSNSDPRARFLEQREVDAISLEGAQQWLENVVRTAPIEASIVGDMKRSQALELALKYLGSLPKRQVSDPALEPLRRLALKDEALVSTVEVPTITPRAVVMVGWRSADWNQVKERRTMQMAAEILDARMRVEIRENRGLTYSANCFNRASKEYPGTSFTAAYFTADPAKAEEAAKLAQEIMEQFAKDGPTAEEMDTVHKQFRNVIEESQKTPGYWADVLSDLHYHGTKLSDVKEALEKYTSYTREDILESLKRYIVEKGRLKVIALPKKVATDKEVRKEG